MQVIEPVRSRCLCIRVAAPQPEEVERLLKHVAKKESIDLPEGLLHRLSKVDFSTVLQMQSKRCPANAKPPGP